jgi:hypothetical protein
MKIKTIADIAQGTCASQVIFHCDKIYQKISFSKEEMFTVVHRFRVFSKMLSWPYCFGPLAKYYIIAETPEKAFLTSC